MNADSLFRQIVFVDTSLAMDGIIPSLSLCHDRLGRLIVALDSALCEKSTSTKLPGQFCLLLCHFIDQRISDSMAKNHHRQPYLTLAQSLYGVREPVASRQEMLKTLLETSTGEVLALSKALLPWLSVLDKGDEQAALLISRWAEPAPLILSEPLPAECDLPAPVVAPPRGISFFVWGFFLLALVALWFCLKAN